MQLARDSAITWVVLFIVLILMVWSVLQIRSRLRDHDDQQEDAGMMLLHMRELHRQGDLTEEEYRLIRGRLSQTTDEDPGTDAAAPAENATESSDDQASEDEAT